ncbi:hypothetical protein EJ03DRAFT_182052 [Teratosphaeria nubilosa]|uniref:F-box domain-containing protein n=1 Tax=Teratosphaeria nubilosa TaxID=161662 RepID=A0A6G1L212_9PEZI|nr:hypothetical protein EJ03DRAFT_182052 [Teratosphaeria nubilosa]
MATGSQSPNSTHLSSNAMTLILTSKSGNSARCGLWDLPSELMDKVFDNVNALDLVSISRINSSFRAYMKKSERYMAQRIAAKHSRRLRNDLSRLDLKGMSILPALQTFISVTGATYDSDAICEFHPSFAWMLEFAACYTRTNEAALDQSHTGWVSREESLATMVREMLMVQIRLELEMPVDVLRRGRQAAWYKLRRRWHLFFKGLVDEWWPDYVWEENEVDEIYTSVADHKLFGPGYDVTRPVTHCRLDPKRHIRSFWWKSEMRGCHHALTGNKHVAQAPDLEGLQMQNLSYSCRDMTAGMRQRVQTTSVKEMPPVMIAALFERAELCIPV